MLCLIPFQNPAGHSFDGTSLSSLISLTCVAGLKEQILLPFLPSSPQPEILIKLLNTLLWMSLH